MGSARGATSPFEGPRAEAPSAPVDAAPTSSPLERLKNGEIDLPGYLDAHVHDATSHLEGLGSEKVGEIRAHLRSATESDPALVALVGQATGQTPETR